MAAVEPTRHVLMVDDEVVILEAFVEQDRSVADIVAMGFDEETVKRVIRAVDRNEYKRRQAPPGVKITPRSFGRDRRMPIVNHYRGF